MKRAIQSSAEDDILRQVEWYVEKGLPDIARRYRAAVAEAIHALVALPAAGPPRHLDNPRLDGLRAWPVKGFPAFRVYYLPRPETVVVVSILHDKRDIRRILEEEAVDDPSLQ